MGSVPCMLRLGYISAISWGFTVHVGQPGVRGVLEEERACLRDVRRLEGKK